MGAWGLGIFDSDLAQDVRDGWREALRDGTAPEEASRALLDDLLDSLDGFDEDAAEVWIALAAAQHETGHLEDHVRDRALAAIADGAELDRWEPEDQPKRRKKLDALAEKLRGPRAKPKRLRRRKEVPSGVEVGDVLRVYDERRRRSALFAVVGPGPVVLGLLWDGGEVPSHEKLAALPPLLETADEEIDAVYAVPVLWGIVTGRKSEVFGSRIGEIVARGVERPERVDEDDIGTYAGWEGLQAFVEHELDASVRAARERLDHRAADPGVGRGDVLRVGSRLYAVAQVGGEHVLPGCPRRRARPRRRRPPSRGARPPARSPVPASGGTRSPCWTTRTRTTSCTRRTRRRSRCTRSGSGPAATRSAPRWAMSSREASGAGRSTTSRRTTPTGPRSAGPRFPDPDTVVSRLLA